jgi:hypothetical protein
LLFIDSQRRGYQSLFDALIDIEKY